MNIPGFAAERSLSVKNNSFYSGLDAFAPSSGEVAPAKIACRLACLYACGSSGGEGDACEASCAEICKRFKGLATQPQF